jgi:hypothetical protein
MSFTSQRVSRIKLCNRIELNEENLGKELDASFLSFIEDRHRQERRAWYHVYLPFCSACIFLLGACGQDVRVTCSALAGSCEYDSRSKLTSIDDGHGGAAEELTAGGSKLNLYRSMLVAALRSHNRTSSQGQPSENTQCAPEYLVVRP